MTANEWLVYQRATVVVRDLGDRLREFRRYGRPRHYWRHRITDFLWNLFA